MDIHLISNSASGPCCSTISVWFGLGGDAVAAGRAGGAGGPEGGGGAGGPWGGGGAGGPGGAGSAGGPWEAGSAGGPGGAGSAGGPVASLSRVERRSDSRFWTLLAARSSIIHTRNNVHH